MTGVLGRYVIRTVLGYTSMVMIVLLALGALFMFIGQQDDIGVGNYTATQALLFVALNLPSYLFQLLPVAALIGSLLGLGNLARGSELIVMRASGVTTARFCLWLGTAGLILGSLMFVVGEYVAPPLGSYARQQAQGRWCRGELHVDLSTDEILRDVVRALVGDVDDVDPGLLAEHLSIQVR